MCLMSASGCSFVGTLSVDGSSRRPQSVFDLLVAELGFTLRCFAEGDDADFILELRMNDRNRRASKDAERLEPMRSCTSIFHARHHWRTVTRTYRKREDTVDAITYTAARANLASTMDRVCEDHEALIITRNGQQSVVMLSLDDYKSLEETAYLLRSPANAKRLLSAVEDLGRGRGKERKLVE